MLYRTASQRVRVHGRRRTRIRSDPLSGRFLRFLPVAPADPAAKAKGRITVLLCDHCFDIGKDSYRMPPRFHVHVHLRTEADGIACWRPFDDSVSKQCRRRSPWSIFKGGGFATGLDGNRAIRRD